MLKKSLYCLGLAACVTLPSWADTSEWGRWSKFRFGGHVRQILATGFYVQTPSGAEVYVRQDQKVLRNGQVINPTFLKPNESVQVIVPPGRGQIRHRDDAVAVLPTADGPTQVPENNLQIAMDQAALASVRQNPAPSAQSYLAAPAPRQNYASAPFYAPALSYGGASSGGGSYGGFYDPYAYDPGPLAYEPGFVTPVPAAPVNYYYQQPYMAPAPYYPAYNNNFTNPNGSFSWENAAVSLVGTALVASLSNQGWNNFNPGWNPGYSAGWNSYDPGYAQNWNPGYAAGWNHYANYPPAYPAVRNSRPWNRPSANNWHWGNQGNVAVYNINQVGYNNWNPRNNGWQRANYRVNSPRYGNWNPRNNGWQRANYRVKGPRNNGWQRANYRVNQQRYNNYRPRNNGWQRANYRVNQQRYNNPRPRNNGWQRANYRVNQQRYNNYRPRNNNWQRSNYRVNQQRYNNPRPRNNNWQRSNYRINQPRYNNFRPQQSQPRFRGGGGNHGGQPRFRGGGGNFGGGQPRFRGGGGNRGGGQPRFRGGGGNFGGGQPRFRGGGGNPGGGGRGRRGR